VGSLSVIGDVKKRDLGGTRYQREILYGHHEMSVAKCRRLVLPRRGCRRGLTVSTYKRKNCQACRVRTVRGDDQRHAREWSRRDGLGRPGQGEPDHDYSWVIEEDSPFLCESELHHQPTTGGRPDRGPIVPTFGTNFHTANAGGGDRL